jgi:hypothetical protein
MQFNLTQQQVQNLSLFLGRAELKGIEVEAFNDLVRALFPPKLGTETGQIVDTKEEVKK